jgi:ribosomal protein S18 acetylase RimI-like enzyme
MPLQTIQLAEPLVAIDIETALLADLQQSAPQGWNETITLSVNATDGRLVAGLVGSTSYGWLLIKMLWVADELRRQGYGRALVLNAFNHAKSLGCHSAWLDTSNRDAMQFYRALEFTVFGSIENSGPQETAGHQRWFLKCPIP